MPRPSSSTVMTMPSPIAIDGHVDVGAGWGVDPRVGDQVVGGVAQRDAVCENDNVALAAVVGDCPIGCNRVGDRSRLCRSCLEGAIWQRFRASDYADVVDVDRLVAAPAHRLRDVVVGRQRRAAPG